jgi:hypothetical protein
VIPYNLVNTCIVVIDWDIRARPFPNYCSETITNISTTADVQIQQTFAFDDSEAQFIATINGDEDPTHDWGGCPDVDLANWLKRPILAATHIWEVGAPFPVIYFNPWAHFLDSPAVAEKLRNFYLMRCKMHMKIIVNGSPMHFGRGMVSYRPLLTEPGERYQFGNTFDPFGEFGYSYGSGGASDNLPLTNSEEVCKVIQSQWPKIFIDPGQSMGGEMIFPFFWGANWFRIPQRDWVACPSEVDPKFVSNTGSGFPGAASVGGPMPVPGLGPYGATYTHAGVVHSSNMAELKHANGATDPVTIQVFLWAEDVKLSLPTSAVPADLRTGLLDLDLVNRTFQAKGRTEYLPDFLGDLSTPGSDNVVDRLEVGSSLLNTASNTVGIQDSNEDAIKTLAMREAWLDSFTWPVSAPAETPLWSARVTPQYFRYQRTDPLVVGAKGPLTAIPSPSAYSAIPFGYWRGTMRYRLQIVASNMHRGRIRIVYDPVADYLMTNDVSVYPEDLMNVQYSRTVDIGGDAGRDFTFDIGYMQQAPYMPLVPIPVSSTGESDSSFDLVTRNYGAPDFTPGYTPNNSSGLASCFTNGVFTIYVLNRLAVPANTVGLNTDVRINVFASCGPDIDFQQPTTRDLNRISFTDPTGFPPNFKADQIPVSVGVLSARSERTFETKMDSAAMGSTEGENVPTDPPLLAEFGETSQPAAAMSSIAFGESMTSWWELMCRWTLYNREIYCRSDANSAQPREGVDRHMVVAPNFPPYPGPSPIQNKWVDLLGVTVGQIQDQNAVPTSPFEKGRAWSRNGVCVPPPAKFTLNAPLRGDDSGEFDPAEEDMADMLRTNPGNLTMLHFVTRLFVARKGSLRNKYVLAGIDPSVGGFSKDHQGNPTFTVKRLPDSGVIQGRTIIDNTLTEHYRSFESANDVLHYFPASGGLWDQAHCCYGLSTVSASGSPDRTTTAISTCQSVNGTVSGVTPCAAPDWCNVTAYPEPWLTATADNLHQPGPYASDVLLQNTFDGAHTNISNLNPVIEAEIPFYANTRFELNELVFTNTTAVQAHAIMWDEAKGNQTRPQAEATFLERYTIPGGDFALYYLANAPLLCLNNALRYVTATASPLPPGNPVLSLVDYSALKYLNGGRQEFCAFRNPSSGTGAYNSSISRVYFYDVPENAQDAGVVRTDGTLFPAGVGTV